MYFYNAGAKKMGHSARTKEQSGDKKSSNRLHIVWIVACAILICNANQPANAHSYLTNSSPKNNSHVYSAPEIIKLNFSDPLMNIKSKQINKVYMRDPNRKLVPLSKPIINGNSITASVNTYKWIKGTYKVYFRIVSFDGHPVSGITTFKFN